LNWYNDIYSYYVFQHKDNQMSKKKAVSEFDEWFIAQHGKPPSSKPSHELCTKVHKLVVELAQAERLLREQRDYESRKTSALYAWNARGAMIQSNNDRVRQ
jgi:hypothetical protein